MVMNELIERLRRMFVVITITRLWTNTPIEATRFFSSYIRFLVSSARTSSLGEAGVGRRWDVTGRKYSYPILHLRQSLRSQYIFLS